MFPPPLSFRLHCRLLPVLVPAVEFFDDDFYGRTGAAVAQAFRNAAGGNPQEEIHSRLQHNPVSCFGEGLFHGDPAVLMEFCVHEQVDRGDEGAALPQGRIDVVQAVGVAGSVVVEKLIHFRTAAGVKQIVLAHVVGDHFHHGPVQIGINGVAGAQFQGLVAVDGHSWRKKFPRISLCLGKKVHHLAAFQVNDGDGVILFHIYFHSGAGRDGVFFDHFGSSWYRDNCRVRCLFHGYAEPAAFAAAQNRFHGGHRDGFSRQQLFQNIQHALSGAFTVVRGFGGPGGGFGTDTFWIADFVEMSRFQDSAEEPFRISVPSVLLVQAVPAFLKLLPLNRQDGVLDTGCRFVSVIHRFASFR